MVGVVERRRNPLPVTAPGDNDNGPRERERTSFVFFSYPQFSTPVPLRNPWENDLLRHRESLDFEFNRIVKSKGEGSPAGEGVSFGEWIKSKWGGSKREHRAG